jgi:hypothetical protein
MQALAKRKRKRMRKRMMGPRSETKDACPPLACRSTF